MNINIKKSIGIALLASLINCNLVASSTGYQSASTTANLGTITNLPVNQFQQTQQVSQQYIPIVPTGSQTGGYAPQLPTQSDVSQQYQPQQPVQQFVPVVPTSAQTGGYAPVLPAQSTLLGQAQLVSTDVNHIHTAENTASSASGAIIQRWVTSSGETH